ncbi:MAG: class I SAM-dependent methyltransferase [Planctomycetota bacterium]
MDFDRLLRNWQNLATKDPLWAILSDEGKQGGRWNLDEFFRSGEGFINYIGEALHQRRIDVARGSALDFGCGYGRLTQALTRHFAKVVGVDAAEAMVLAARKHNRFGERVAYVYNPAPDLAVFPSASFDFVLTVLVLQHMRADFQQGYLREFLRVLRPGGVLFVQIPTVPTTPVLDSISRLDEVAGEACIEIHGQSQASVEALFLAAGGELLYAEADTWAGVEWGSMHYCVRRQR